MTKIYSILFLLSIVLGNILISSHPVFAQNSAYNQISNLSIGQTLDPANLGTLILKKNTGLKKIYSAPSTQIVYSHLVHTNLQNQIIFIQLIIPDDFQSQYLSLLTSKGTPEDIIKYSDLTEILEFPTQGISFFTNLNATSIQMIHYYQPVVMDLHKQLYGQGYEPLDIPVPTSAPSNTFDNDQDGDNDFIDLKLFLPNFAHIFDFNSLIQSLFKL